jgi:hypothetical protein
MGFGYPVSPFCFYFAHYLHGLNNTPMKIVRQQSMLPNELLYILFAVASFLLQLPQFTQQ